MKQITKNSLVATAVMSVVYIFNLVRPEMVVYSIAAIMVMIVISGKYFLGLSFNLNKVATESKFVIMPILFNVSAVSYISYVYIGLGRFVLTFLAIISNYYLYVSLRKLKNLSERAAIFYRNILVVLSFFTVFLVSAMNFRLFMAISDSSAIAYGRLGIVIATFLLVYFVTYFLSWEKNTLESKYRGYALVSALLCSQIAWIATIWSVNYPVLGNTEKATLGGTPIAAVLLTLTYYFLWGTISHKLDQNLTRKVLTEYLLFSVLFIAVLIATARWLPLG